MTVDFRITDRQWYEIHGHTVAAVADAVAHLAEPGVVEWFPYYGCEDDGTVVTAAAVTVDTRVTLPTWSELAAAAPEDQAEWDRFHAAVVAHTDCHLALVATHLAEADTWLVGCTPEEAGARWQQGLLGLQAASEALDAETDHGRLSGAAITTMSPTHDQG